MFYINRSRPTKNGDCPINMRITINGESLAMFGKNAEIDPTSSE
jgi:hypothetical protein